MDTSKMPDGGQPRPFQRKAAVPLKAAMRGAGVVIVAMLVVVALMIATQVIVTRHWAQTSAFYLASTLTLAFFYHVLGGEIGAALSHDSKPVTIALILAGAALMISSVHHTWPTVAPWYSVTMLLLAPSGLTLGVRAHARRHPPPPACDNRERCA